MTFSQNSVPFPLSFRAASIMISEFQKSMFSNWETLLFAKWKTRSANYSFRQPKRLSGWLFSEFCSIFIVFSCCFRMRMLRLIKLGFWLGNLLFWCSEIAFKNSRKRQWKWSRILRKSHSDSLLDCLKPWFAERVFHFAKSNVSQLENLFLLESRNHDKSSRKIQWKWNRVLWGCIFDITLDCLKQ